MPALVENGRAKVNLTLRVVGRRVDGYHDLESMVAFADCADRLSLTPGSKLDLKTTGPLARDCGEASDNLVFKAAQLLGERAVTGRFDHRFQLVEIAADGAGQLRVVLDVGFLLAQQKVLLVAPRLQHLDRDPLGQA